MRLESARIRNFKLLEDVALQFSSDLLRPLTVIRAENGSGKTSILYALRWGMYGEEGIPSGMRLTSTAKPPGQPVLVQVSLEFTRIDPFSDAEARYRLIRTCEEIPEEGDSYDRRNERRRLLRWTEKGEEDIVEGIDGWISAMLPLNLADVFFTNGDDVQRFISSGQQAERERQEAVHKTIRQLLGLDEVESAEKHLVSVARKMKRELTATGSEDLKTAQDNLDKVEGEITEQKENLSTINHRIAKVDEQIRLDERELDSIKGVGDLDAIQERIHALEKDIRHLEGEDIDIRKQMKEHLRSEALSKWFIEDKLQSGLAKLNELADRNVIPGTSIEVLIDRLQLGLCICGEDLEVGHPRRTHVQNLIEEQRQIAPRIQQLTSLWHEARNSIKPARAAVDDGGSVSERVVSLMDRFTQCRDRQRQKNADLRNEREKREQIDEERIQGLTQRVHSNRGKRSKFDQEYGQINGHFQELEERRQLCAKRVTKEESKATLSKTLRRRSSVASDLVKLTKGTLDRLKSIYVKRVSARMNELFLDIVGSDPTADTTVFTGVSINEKYDIVIHTLEGRTLDANTELNGASQRALTLSFIWALMEVAEREAPRIIDTPLGMTSGAVKQRMVEILTKPVDFNGLPYQVVLFMTRSEIRDIEPLIKDRAGIVTTLTCSKDYPVDLINDWGTGIPIVRVCECNHTEICHVCERRNDASRFTYREART